MGRGMGRGMPAEPLGARDPRSLVSYVDVDAPKVGQPVGCTFAAKPVTLYSLKHGILELLPPPWFYLEIFATVY